MKRILAITGPIKKYTFMVLLAAAVCGVLVTAINHAVASAAEEIRQWQAPPVYFKRKFYDI